MVGVAVEIFAPEYMKFLLSRISVWFYLASMVIVAYTGYEIFIAKFGRSIKNTIVFSVLMLGLLLGQTSILSTYTGIRDFKKDVDSYKQYLATILELKKLVPLGQIILSNPSKEASAIRAYGGYGVYVSWKDGNVSLVDGNAATKWFARYNETAKIFSQKNFFVIKKFAIEHDLQYYLFDVRDVERGMDELTKVTIFKSGDYGLAKLY